MSNKADSSFNIKNSNIAWNLINLFPTMSDFTCQLKFPTMYFAIINERLRDFFQFFRGESKDPQCRPRNLKFDTKVGNFFYSWNGCFSNFGSFLDRFPTIIPHNVKIPHNVVKLPSQFPTTGAMQTQCTMQAKTSKETKT